MQTIVTKTAIIEIEVRQTKVKVLKINTNRESQNWIIFRDQ